MEMKKDDMIVLMLDSLKDNGMDATVEYFVEMAKRLKVEFDYERYN